ncbi:MAG: PQQ-binding-like beta-propeller repeat protein [Phycisphaerales bacterium]|nr:PQQ-binding-like beta-propeller repeat protein [Phycisphaerales bacterium]
MRGTPGAAVLVCLAGCALPATGQDGAWPVWQRTPTRLGNTTTVGPKTPTIGWSMQFDPDSYDIAYNGSPIMDATGRVYLCVNHGLVAIDTDAREVAWSFVISDNGGYTPAYDSGVVVFGSATDYVYGVDAETGQGLWSFPEPGRPNLSPVAADGVVYYITQFGDLKARAIADGSLLWAIQMGTSAYSAPAADQLGQVFSSSWSHTQAWAVLSANGAQAWVRQLPARTQATMPVDLDAASAGRAYYMDRNANLTAFDRLTGDQAWTIKLGNTSAGMAGVSVGHEGTLYAGVYDFQSRSMCAVDPDGQLLWKTQFATDDTNSSPPIVDGDGTIYFTSYKTASTPIGRVHALNPDGSVLWIKDMPERVASSPMLAPDGTLYVNCSDTYLYAFKDPCPADFNGDGAANTLDVLAFLNAWAAGDARADFNGDGSINTLDVLAFLNAWSAGCA